MVIKIIPYYDIHLLIVNVKNEKYQIKMTPTIIFLTHLYNRDFHIYISSEDNKH